MGFDREADYWLNVAFIEEATRNALPRPFHALELLDDDRVLGRENPGAGGHFGCDPDSTSGAPVFNRTAPLKDQWTKIERTVNR